MIWADTAFIHNMIHLVDIEMGESDRWTGTAGALAVHLAAPLRRRKSTFEHEPYGAADIAMHRVH